MGTKHFFAFFGFAFTASLFAEPASVEWQEAGRSHKAYLVPGLIANFHPQQSERNRFGKRISAKREIEQAAASVFRVPQAKYRQAFRQASDRFQAPVFSDSPRGGQLRSLPGGVLVTFPEGVDAENWAKANQRKLVQQIGSGTTWLVETPPGLKSLETAKELGGDPSVVASTPNWWIHLEARTALPSSEELTRLRRSLNNPNP